jgi:hypothetical protein
MLRRHCYGRRKATKMATKTKTSLAAEVRMVELIEVEPGRWRVKREQAKAARSDLPLPYVISDIMEPTEQVDGRFYTSKRQFRAVGRALGLTEVGTEKPKPRKRILPDREGRRQSIQKAVARYKAGERHAQQK